MVDLPSSPFDEAVFNGEVVRVEAWSLSGRDEPAEIKIRGSSYHSRINIYSQIEWIGRTCTVIDIPVYYPNTDLLHLRLTPITD
jgi:hypothetical protein